MSLYADDSQVRELTASIVARGHSIFQIYKFGDDESHVRKLLSLFAPPSGRMLDAGCGIGTVSALMKAERPDLECVLLNVSQSQLDLCPPMERIHGDFHNIPVADGSFASAMFNYSLGHGRLDDVMKETARILRPGGVLFIYDIASDDPESIFDALEYRTFPECDVVASAEANGLRCSLSSPAYRATNEAFMDLFDRETFTALFHGVRPVAYRFVKEAIQ